MRRKAVMAALLANSMLAAPAFAQDSATSGLDEIVVTAQIKSENIPDVPIVVTLITGEQLQSKSIRSLDEVAFHVPNLSFRNKWDIKHSPISLRFVFASTGSAGQHPSVATYVDEVFVSAGAGANIAYYDLEAVEVFRGPQGTLFGRDDIGDMFYIRMLKPTFNTKGYAKVKIETFNHTLVMNSDVT